MVVKLGGTQVMIVLGLIDGSCGGFGGGCCGFGYDDQADY